MTALTALNTMRATRRRGRRGDRAIARLLFTGFGSLHNSSFSSPPLVSTRQAPPRAAEGSTVDAVEMVRFTNSGKRIPSIIPRVRLTEGWRKKLSRENATSPAKVHPEPQQQLRRRSKSEPRRKSSTPAPTPLEHAATDSPSIAPLTKEQEVHQQTAHQRHSAAEELGVARKEPAGQGRRNPPERPGDRRAQFVHLRLARRAIEVAEAVGLDGGAPGRPVVGEFPRRRRDALRVAGQSEGARGE